MNNIFHTIEEIPKYDSQLLIQFENGSYNQFHYWAMSLEELKRFFSKWRVNTGPVIRWCYIGDLDKVT